VEAYGISWSDAKAAAESSSYLGLPGYLATITSEDEDNYVALLHVPAPEGAWIGGSDRAVEGDWRWVTGPEGLEDGGQGRLFWSYDWRDIPGNVGEWFRWGAPAEPSNDPNGPYGEDRLVWEEFTHHPFGWMDRSDGTTAVGGICWCLSELPGFEDSPGSGLS
jgi:hypothetical protein